MKELFIFYPQRFGYDPSSIDEVHLVGEFNQWGKNIQKLDEFKLVKDKTCKWVGAFNVFVHNGSYKYLLNRNTVCPEMSLMHYSHVQTPEWANTVVWYQIMADRFFKGDHSIKTPGLIPWDCPPDYFNNFGGDLKGIKEKIPYFKNLFGDLKNLAIYLNPIHKSTASNHKYWPEDFFEIDPQFGSWEDLKSLTDALHKEGAKIIIDLVYNHTGLNHPAFMDVLKYGKNSRYFNWYRDLPNDKIEIPVLENYLGDKPQNVCFINDPRDRNFDPSKECFIDVWLGKYRFPVTDPERFKNSSVEEIINHQPYYKLVHMHNNPNYKCWAGFFEIPELNTKNPEVKKHLFDAAKLLIKNGVDGFRLDVPDLLSDAHDFWQEFRREMREEMTLNEKNPDDLYIVGEIWTGKGLTGSYLLPDKEGKPLRFDAIMNYPVRENVLNFFSGEILNPASDAVANYGEISVEELDRNLNKNLGYISWGVDQVQFNVFSSHDTRRLRTVLNDDRKFKAALAMQFTLPGTPTIYYGDELGMTGGNDPANRAPMAWGILENLLQNQSEAHIFNFYKKLIDLRTESCLTEGSFLTVTVDNENKVYAYSRFKDCSDYLLVIVARDGIKEDLNIDISGLPFENTDEWTDYITGKSFINYGKSITFQPKNFEDSFGLILIPEL